MRCELAILAPLQVCNKHPAYPSKTCPLCSWCYRICGGKRSIDPRETENHEADSSLSLARGWKTLKVLPAKKFNEHPSPHKLHQFSNINLRIFKMATESKKRPISAPNASQKSKKRQKVEPPAKTQTVEKRSVAQDALPWNEVKLPDMFDDAEGFFGLEEVEGVEVIKEGEILRFVSYDGYV